MRRIGSILLFALLLSAVSCFKEVAYRTEYVLKPLRQGTSDDRNPAVIPGAAAFAFDADTAAWTVASYDDALAGVITSKSDPAVRQSAPLAASQPYVFEGAEGWISLALDRERQMIVAVDPVDRLYAYTDQSIGVNLSPLYVSLTFQPWKTGFSYKNGNWSIYNEFYEPPLLLDCFVAAAVQEREGARSRRSGLPRSTPMPSTPPPGGSPPTTMPSPGSSPPNRPVRPARRPISLPIPCPKASCSAWRSPPRR